MSHLLTLDNAIVALYLLVTLVVGLYYGRGIKTMKDYVIGDRKRYSTTVLVAAVFATVLGGAGTLGLAEKVFAGGLIWVIVFLGNPISKMIMAWFIAPHVMRFHKKLSVGEMMGDFYGKPGRMVTGITGAAKSVGSVGAQIGAIGYVFYYFLNLSQVWGVVIACGIVVIYSAFGGIRSVTATDLIQFAVLIIAIPIVACKSLWQAGWYTGIYNAVSASHFAVLSHNDLWKYVFIFLVISIPYMDPARMQRFLMARDVQQAHTSWKVTGVLEAVVITLIGLIALSVATISPANNPHTTLPYAVDMVLSTGIKGLGIIGLFSIFMSSADSFLHAAAVSLVHDVVQPLRKQPLHDSQELKLTRLVTLFLGVASMVAAISFKSIMDLTLAAFNFWIPISVVPLFAGIVGYRSSIRSFAIAAISGAITTVTWKTGLGTYVDIGATIPGLLANLIAFSIARRFDKPEELHFGKDELKDPRMQKYIKMVRKRHAKRRQFFRSLLTQQAVRSTWRFAKLTYLFFVRTCWQLPYNVSEFYRERLLAYQPPYKVIACLGILFVLTPFFAWVDPHEPYSSAVFIASAVVALGWVPMLFLDHLKGAAAVKRYQHLYVVVMLTLGWSGIAAFSVAVSPKLTAQEEQDIVGKTQSLDVQLTRLNSVLADALLWQKYSKETLTEAAALARQSNKTLVKMMRETTVHSEIINMSTGSALMWFVALLLVLFLMDNMAAWPLSLLGSVMGGALGLMVGGGDFGEMLLQAPAGVLLMGGFCVVLGVVLAGVREAQGYLRAAVFHARQAFVGHEINRPLVKMGMAGRRLQENMDDLIAAHQQVADMQANVQAAAGGDHATLAQGERRFKRKKRTEYLRLRDMGNELMESSKQGFAFNRKLMSENRTDPTKLNWNPEILDLHSCVSQACSYGVPDTKKKYADVEYDLEGLLVFSDKDYLVPAFGNLIKNAREHTAPDQTIRIWFEDVPQDPTNHYVHVGDTGDGMGNRGLLRGFQAGGSRKKGGHGYGLPLVKQTMLLSGGDVYANAMRGMGTDFLVVLPKPAAQQVKRYNQEKTRKHVTEDAKMSEFRENRRLDEADAHKATPGAKR
ncbi:MAG: ATP-binding protein [Myxococcota bacterium]